MLDLEALSGRELLDWRIARLLLLFINHLCGDCRLGRIEVEALFIALDDALLEAAL